MGQDAESVGSPTFFGLGRSAKRAWRPTVLARATILAAAQEAASMVLRNRAGRSKTKAKTILRLPDLEQSKSAVLHSLGAASSQESYRHAIDEFIGWYCSESRLTFNRTVVLGYRFFLEQKNLAPSTINVRLAAVRPLPYQASH